MILFHDGIISNTSLLELISEFNLDLVLLLGFLCFFVFFFLCIICHMIHFHEGIIGNASLLELISNFYLDLDFIIGFPLFFFNVQELIF